MLRKIILTKLNYNIHKKIARDHSSIPNLEDLHWKSYKNNNIYGSQKLNDLLYYKRAKQKTNILVRIIITLLIQNWIQIQKRERKNRYFQLLLRYNRREKR